MEDKKLKIIAYIADQYGCSNWRLIRPLTTLDRLGLIEGRIYNVISDQIIQWGDVAIFQRQNSPAVFDEFIKTKALGKKVIVEVDDYFHKVPLDNPAHQYYVRKPDVLRMITKFMENADACTFSTEYLAKAYAPYAKRSYILPNNIDFSIWADPPSEPTVRDRIRIGWTGSATHKGDLKIIRDVMEKILGEFPNVTFVLVGYFPKDVFSSIASRIEFHPGVWNTKHLLEEYSEFLSTLSLDIGLAPLVDNEFNRSKSCIKILEYASMKVPCVASKVEPYAKAIKNYVHGILVDNKFSDWYKGIKTLILNEKLRRTLANNAYSLVKAKYDLEKNILNWYNAYREVFLAKRSKEEERKISEQVYQIQKSFQEQTTNLDPAELPAGGKSATT